MFRILPLALSVFPFRIRLPSPPLLQSRHMKMMAMQSWLKAAVPVAVVTAPARAVAAVDTQTSRPDVREWSRPYYMRRARERRLNSADR
jgi:hypothetical protein